MPMELYRDGAKITLPVSIGEWPREIWESKMDAAPKLNDYADFGVSFLETPDGPKVKSIVERSVAWSAGLREGDVIKRVGPVTIKTIGEMGGVIDEMFNRKGKTSALLLVSGPSGERWVDVAIAE